MSRRIVAIIQARMGSTRLPGKVLADIGGATALARVLRRGSRATALEEIVVATSTNPADQAIVDECARLNVRCFRGSEQDVLERYYQAATYFAGDAIVRITADCPLIDPELLDQLVDSFLSSGCDYASNALLARYPRGLGAEVFTIDALFRAQKEANLTYERVHVTPYFYEHPELFRICSVIGATDHSHHRWTLDTPEDLEFIRAIYSRFNNRDDFSWREVLDVIAREPHLAEINCQVRQKELQEC